MPMSGGEPLTLRRRWLAITLASIALQFSFWPILTATTAAGVEGFDGGGLLAFGLALVPLVFGVLAFASRHPNAPAQVLKAMGLFILIGVPVTLVNALVGIVLGFGAGGIVTLRPAEPDAAAWRWRALAIGAAYIVGLLFIAPDFAVISAAVLPFGVLGLVDQAAEGSAAERSDASGQQG
jgi:hypothetical protein